MAINVAAQADSGYVVALLRYYAALAAGMQSEESCPSRLGTTTVVSREPMGVVSANVLWNFPVIVSMIVGARIDGPAYSSAFSR